MRFGISFLPDATPATKPAATYFADALELAARADVLGLHSAKMTEHYMNAYGGYCPDPLAFFSAVAARTSRLRLMTGCVLPVFHHPIQLAASAAMVDAISGGRLDVGFARAYMPYEFDALGVDMNRCRDRFQATIEAVVRLWTEKDVTIDTPFFRFRQVNSLPPPTQRPHPPVWCAAVRSRESFAWIGQQRFKLMATFLITPRAMLREFVSIYRESFESSSQPASHPAEVAVSIPLYVAEDDATAAEEGGYFLGRYFRVWAGAAGAWDHRKAADYPGYQGMAQAIQGTTPASMRQNLSAIIGSPDHVADRIQELERELGPDQVLWQIDFGAMPGDRAMRTLNLFAEEVLPRLPVSTQAQWRQSTMSLTAG